MERLQLTGSEAAVGAAWQAREALQWVLWSFTGQNLAAWGTAGPRGWPVAAPKKMEKWGFCMILLLTLLGI